MDDQVTECRPRVTGETTRREAVLAMGGFAALMAMGRTAWAAQYPERAVEFICGFAPGGGTDLLARALADALAEDLGQPFQVINRAGGGGVVSFEEIASAKPDGYKIGILTAQLITANLRGVMQRSFADFTPVSMVTIDYAGFAVKADSPIQNFKQFIENAKANPGAVTVGNGGEGGSFHMLARDLEGQAGIHLKHIPFEGGPAAILQLLGGHIDSTVNGPTELLPYVQSGQLRLLAVSGPERMAEMPDVPTTAELGYPLNIATWRAVGMPKDVPAEIVSTLEAAIARAVKAQPFQETMKKIGSNIAYLDSAGLRDYLAKQEGAYRKIFG